MFASLYGFNESLTSMAEAAFNKGLTVQQCDTAVYIQERTSTCGI